MPIGDVAYSWPYDAFIGKSTQGGLVGRETIEGISCVKLDYNDAVVEVRLWLPTSGQPLPRRMEIVYKQVPALPVSQINFRSWNLESPVADAPFAFEPPQGQGRIELSDLIAGLSSGSIRLAKPAGSPAAR